MIGVETLAIAADLPDEAGLTMSTVNIYTTLVSKLQCTLDTLSVNDTADHQWQAAHACLAYNVSNTAAEINCLTNVHKKYT